MKKIENLHVKIRVKVNSNTFSNICVGKSDSRSDKETVSEGK